MQLHNIPPLSISQKHHTHQNPPDNPPPPSTNFSTPASGGARESLRLPIRAPISLPPQAHNNSLRSCCSGLNNALNRSHHHRSRSYSYSCPSSTLINSNSANDINRCRAHRDIHARFDRSIGAADADSRVTSTAVVYAGV